MQSISEEEFHGRLAGLRRESLHLESRDAYGTSTELPHMAKWARGEPDDLAWLDGWCDQVREQIRRGLVVRRARIVSEPLSDYQRWSRSIAQPMVDAGEDIRWCPRRRVSSVAIPGNDFYLIDNELVVFLHYAGNGLIADMVASTDSADLDRCRAAFEEVWQLSIPHGEYQPV